MPKNGILSLTLNSLTLTRALRVTCFASRLRQVLRTFALLTNKGFYTHSVCIASGLDNSVILYELLSMVSKYYFHGFIFRFH